jgi:hypothetical protein
MILQEKVVEFVVIWNCVIVIHLVMFCAYHLIMFEDLSFLGCYTVMTAKELPVFIRSVVPVSSGSGSCRSPLLGLIGPEDGVDSAALKCQ